MEVGKLERKRKWEGESAKFKLTFPTGKWGWGKGGVRKDLSLRRNASYMQYIIYWRSSPTSKTIFIPELFLTSTPGAGNSVPPFTFYFCSPLRGNKRLFFRRPTARLFHRREYSPQIDLFSFIFIFFYWRANISVIIARRHPYVSTARCVLLCSIPENRPRNISILSINTTPTQLLWLHSLGKREK